MKPIDSTKSICLECLKPVDATIYEQNGKIFMRKQCPVHGEKTGLISSNAAWYHRVMSFKTAANAPAVIKSATSQGCPLDCGFCPEHQQRTYMPVVSITSACNLNCPVCYTINKQQDPFFMSKDEFATILDVIKTHDQDMQIINFTGGEPTVHPQFLDLVDMCDKAGIHRITVSTNGLALLENPELLPRLTELKARIVLSFNSFHSEPYRVSAGIDLLDKKLKILDLLSRYRPSTSLLSVVMANVNDTEIGEIVRFIFQSDFIVSSQIHTVAFTGQASGTFNRTTRITTPDIIADIADKNEHITMNDFLPSPCAHPLCYNTCYVLKLDDGQYVPLTRFISTENMVRLLSGNFYMEPNLITEEILTDSINELWSKADEDELDQKILSGLKTLLRKLYPTPPISYAKRQQIAEKYIKTVYISSHMDDENFDLDRISHCCVSVPYEDGRLIPTCAYNNIYRQRDKRFYNPGIDGEK